MPTPSEIFPDCPVQKEEWAARPAQRPNSVFGNCAERGPAEVQPLCTAHEAHKQPEADYGQSAEPLQTAIDIAFARSFFYRFLAQAYEDPTKEGWDQLTKASCLQNLESAAGALAATTPSLVESAAPLCSQLKSELFESFLAAYLTAFGHAARGRCPLNEIEYGDIKADPLFQPHRLADIAAFYRAFGLEVAEDADERHDHICLELEFMCVLAAKEAYALELQLDSEALSVCRDAQKRFLREHLARWTPAFARRLARMAEGTPLCAVADLTRAFVESECARHGIPTGSEDLLLRPVDEASESACHSCGVTQPLPGALPPALSPA
jgi:DMSO reductase family type II enzyme chaperone